MKRTLDVLGAFDEQHRRLSLAHIAQRAGLPVPTTLRIVRELADHGALVRGEDRSYRIGRRLWDLGLLAPTESDLRELAAPLLHDLHAATRATVHLAVREGESALYLDRIAGQSSVPVVSRIGSRLPLYATGVGKVLLAYAPADVTAAAMAHLKPLTPHTVTAPGLLARQLARVRSEGYATTREEMTLGACSVGVPVRSGSAVVAAIGVVVPDVRRDRARLIAALTMAARGIGRRLAAERSSRELTP
ncbi:IclR family transcriptional regulator [uncultured Aeromicrobium sp.]|uniref:IclR family transcriptional regulator n=1 Tax=uncultured Aeromicrobium sp. TaxID=337820 RepID=UPI0025F2873D|nr:IclR family transcriptional regulator [uncultured Aeromicrobium sp.]